MKELAVDLHMLHTNASAHQTVRFSQFYNCENLASMKLLNQCI